MDVMTTVMQAVPDLSQRKTLLHYSSKQVNELPFTPDVVTKVIAKHPLPFNLFPYQVEGVCNLAPLPRAGLYMDPGTGKTAVSTVMALYHILQNWSDQVLVIMPPVLLISWQRWLESIPGVSVQVYAGTPKQRESLPLDRTFTLMSMDIFKRDFERLEAAWAYRRMTIIVDEATSVKNISSDNHKKVRNFVEMAQHRLLLLTGTPLATPMDTYGYCKLISPTLYLNKRLFEAMHVEELDYFGNVSRWKSLDTMKDNLLHNACRAVKQELLDDLPPITFQQMPYKLDASHYKLYQRIAEEQLIELADGGKIDATTPNKLYVRLQQVIYNLAHFSGDPKAKPAGLEIVKEVLDELGERKLIIFAYYRMTIAALKGELKEYGAVALNGDEPATQRQKTIDAFLTDPKCRVLIAQPKSGGVGLNLQASCADVLFVELPLTPGDFDQAISRVYRQGQKLPVTIRIAIADRTLQVRVYKRLLDKDSLINKVTPSAGDLRDAIYGG